MTHLNERHDLQQCTTHLPSLSGQLKLSLRLHEQITSYSPLSIQENNFNEVN